MKLFLCDFDGTLVRTDILDVLCDINGKEEESRRLNEEFIQGKREGLPTLKQRIDFLHGISEEQIKAKLDENDYLVKGAKELFHYLRNEGYITVLHSGNIIPVLDYYKNILGIDYVVGNKPRMNGGIIDGIEIEDFAGRDFKLQGCQTIIAAFDVSRKDIVAMGDSPADKAIFDIAGLKIAINSKGEIDRYADIILEDDLSVLPAELSDRNNNEIEDIIAPSDDEER